MTSPRLISSSKEAARLFVNLQSLQVLYHKEQYAILYLDTLNCVTGFMLQPPGEYGKATLHKENINNTFADSLRNSMSGEPYKSFVDQPIFFRKIFIGRNTMCGEFEFTLNDKIQVREVVEFCRLKGIEIVEFVIYNEFNYKAHPIYEILGEPKPKSKVEIYPVSVPKSYFEDEVHS